MKPYKNFVYLSCLCGHFESCKKCNPFKNKDKKSTKVLKMKPDKKK